MQPLLDPLDPAALYSICKNAIDTGDLACLNGGSLHALNDSSSNSCAYCDCPSGWLGADCSLCTATDACPTRTHVTTGEVLQPSFCSAPSLEPLEEEFSPEIGGKSFSCFCGGDDPTTQWVCGCALFLLSLSLRVSFVSMRKFEERKCFSRAEGIKKSL